MSIISFLHGKLADAGSAEVSFSDANLTPAQLGSILDMLEAETIAAKSGRKLLALLMGGDKREPAAIVEQLGLAQISDNKLLVWLFAESLV